MMELMSFPLGSACNSVSSYAGFGCERRDFTARRMRVAGGVGDLAGQFPARAVEDGHGVAGAEAEDMQGVVRFAAGESDE